MTKPTLETSYLGDSVYIGILNGQLAIWLDNGDGPKNVIVIDECAPELFDYLDKVLL